MRLSCSRSDGEKSSRANRDDSLCLNSSRDPKGYRDGKVANFRANDIRVLRSAEGKQRRRTATPLKTNFPRNNSTDLEHTKYVGRHISKFVSRQSQAKRNLSLLLLCLPPNHFGSRSERANSSEKRSGKKVERNIYARV